MLARAGHGTPEARNGMPIGRVCNGNGREGVGFDANGAYDMRCVSENCCDECESGAQRLVAAAGPSEASILRTLSPASPD